MPLTNRLKYALCFGCGKCHVNVPCLQKWLEKE